MVTKKMDVPDIGNLLGEITKKRESGELPKTEIQYIQSVKIQELNNSKEFESNNLITQKSKNSKTQKQEAPRIVGRPMKLKSDIEYFKISPRIPRTLKEELDVALARRQFIDEDGQPVTTVDGIVELALSRLLYK